MSSTGKARPALHRTVKHRTIPYRTVPTLPTTVPYRTEHFQPHRFVDTPITDHRYRADLSLIVDSKTPANGGMATM
eukprot:scaffold589715_cov19-Prasinocladus_malaysianus.AAC.2